MATFVLVHGACCGGWAWKTVARLLRDRGHEVYTPTLTGLGERVHVGRPETNLDTHIHDVENLLWYEDLGAVVLVGWSYGGAVVQGVADRVPERIGHIIHVDGNVLENGTSLFDTVPGLRDVAEASARDTGDGWRASLGDAAAFDEMFRTRIPDDTFRRWVAERMTTQPIQTFAQPTRLSHPNPAGVRQTFVRCALDIENEAEYAPIIARIRTAPNWEYRDIPYSHAAPVSHPDAVARTLHDLSI